MCIHMYIYIYIYVYELHLTLCSRYDCVKTLLPGGGHRASGLRRAGGSCISLYYVLLCTNTISLDYVYYYAMY